MNNQLVRFDIVGLHGVRDFSISITGNRIILVGENGSGKTTVFKMMYYTLSCDWDSLCTIDFDHVTILFSNDQVVTISSSLLKSIFEIDTIDRVQYYVDGRRYHRPRFNAGVLNSVIGIIKATESKNEMELDRFFSDTSLPYSYIKGVLNAKPIKELYKITQKIETCFNATILYLPTYRRIEEQLKTIFPNTDSEEWKKTRHLAKKDRSIELVEFGMDDVEKAVKDYQEHLKDYSRAQQNKLTLGYLSEIIEEKYEQVDIENIRNLTEQQISDILMRIEQSILSDVQKAEITRILSHTRDTLEQPAHVREKIICHYFLKIIDFDREMNEEEASLLRFIEICNKYLVNNYLFYDKQSFACSIKNVVDCKCNNSKNIHFQDLSSGEKQIVSIFSHLNLTQEKEMFVFIDEPELSLSVDWQRSFLPDIVSSPNCCGLIATTHSPFIFDNALEEIVHGINEFCTRG